jgi:hypothetical protein
VASLIHAESVVSYRPTYRGDAAHWMNSCPVNL